MSKRTDFKLRFKDNGPCGDYTMILRTTEPEYEENIKEEIINRCWSYRETKEDFYPIDVLDEICDEHGWDWEDADYQEVVFTRQQWMGYRR